MGAVMVEAMAVATVAASEAAKAAVLAEKVEGVTEAVAMEEAKVAASEAAKAAVPAEGKAETPRRIGFQSMASSWPGLSPSERWKARRVLP